MKPSFSARPMIAGGNLYPDDRIILNNLIEDSFSTHHGEKIENPFAIIAPYAGYQIASAVYASSYAQIKDQVYDTAIIIAPIHKTAFPGIALTQFDSFITPLGELYVDEEANTFLNEFNSEFIFFNDRYHKMEFSIEAQLPYLTKVCNNKVKIIPIIIGESNTKFTILLSRAIQALFEKMPKRYLIIVATNLSQEIEYNQACKTDERFASLFMQNNPDLLAEQLAMNQIQARGGGGVITLLRLANLVKKDNLKILQLSNSGDFNGEKLKVDGYISAVVY